jgi:hypothetical protein
MMDFITLIMDTDFRKKHEIVSFSPSHWENKSFNSVFHHYFFHE